MDADFSHDPQDIALLYNVCKNGQADVSIGSRYKEGINVVNWPVGRIILSLFASYYVRFLTGMNIKDPTSGYRSLLICSGCSFDRPQVVLFLRLLKPLVCK